MRLAALLLLSSSAFAQFFGGGGGASNIAGITDCRVSRTNIRVLTLAACRIRAGTLLWSFSQTTISIASDAPSDTALIFAENGSLVVGYSDPATTITGSGFTTRSGLTVFPASVVPIFVWPATTVTGQWNTSGTDYRAILETWPQPEPITFRALCQNTVAGSNFSLAASNAPTQTCVTGANAHDPTAAATAWNWGLLAFAENASAATAQSVQGSFVVPPIWSASSRIEVWVRWRAAATSGAVVWQIQGQCVGDAEVPGNFSSAVAFAADTAKGTTLQWNDVTKTLTASDALAGCAAGEQFMFRLFRDATHASDTLAAVDLVSATFRFSR